MKNSKGGREVMVLTKSDITLVHMSQKCTSSKKSSQDKYHDICNYCKNKGHWEKKCSKRKKKKTYKDIKSKKLEKKV